MDKQQTKEVRKTVSIRINEEERKAFKTVGIGRIRDWAVKTARGILVTKKR